MRSSSQGVASSAPGVFVATPLPVGSRAFAPVRPCAGLAAAPPSATPPSLEQERASAYAEGVAAGRAELPWQEAESLRSAAAALEESARALGALRRTYLVAHRLALVDLAVALAERILAREIQADRNALAGIVERALALVPDCDAVRVGLAPGDLQALEAGLAPLLARLAEEHRVALEADPALTPGDVRVLAGTTRVDARLGDCLERMREDLAELADSEEGTS